MEVAGGAQPGSDGRRGAGPFHSSSHIPLALLKALAGRARAAGPGAAFRGAGLLARAGRAIAEAGRVPAGVLGTWSGLSERREAPTWGAGPWGGAGAEDLEEEGARLQGSRAFPS